MADEVALPVLSICQPSSVNLSAKVPAAPVLGVPLSILTLYLDLSTVIVGVGVGVGSGALIFTKYSGLLPPETPQPSCNLTVT